MSFISLKNVFIIRESQGSISLEQLASEYPAAHAAWLDFENNEKAEMGGEYTPSDVSFEMSPEGELLAFISDGFHTTADPWIFRDGRWVYSDDAG